MKQLLSICIPTYNGKIFLEYNINKFIKLNENMILRYAFQIMHLTMILKVICLINKKFS